MTESKCPYCDKMIPDVWRMQPYDGYVIWFNEHNQFAHRHDFPEPGKGTAQSLKKKSKKASKAPQAEVGELGERLTDWLQNPDDEDIAEAARISTVQHLANIVEQGGGGATKAVEIIGNMVGEMFKSWKPPSPGEKCRLCGRLDKPPVVRISRELAESAWDGEGLS